MNQGTPMGMSTERAMDIIGGEGGGIPFRTTAIQDTQALISLMDDDGVLSFLDVLEDPSIFAGRKP